MVTPVPVLKLTNPEPYGTAVDPGHEFDDCILQTQQHLELNAQPGYA